MQRRDFIRSAALSGAAAWVTGSLTSPLVGQVPAAPAPAKGVPTTTKPDPYADAVFQDGPPPATADGAFSFILLPDTQFYTETYPKHLHSQIDWILSQHDSRRIAGVFQLGDITNRNSEPEWKNAVAGFSKLDGKIPYCLNLGNHDYAKGGTARDRTTLFNEFFKYDTLSKQSHFGGVYDREPKLLQNAYYRLNAGGRDWLILCLEFGPRNDVLRWAGEILKQHPKHTAILTTHAFVYHDDTRYDYAKYGEKQEATPHKYGMSQTGDMNDAEEMWQKFIFDQPTIAWVFNGHVVGDGLGRVVENNRAGKPVEQHLVNFQMKPNGGDGWLRVLEVSPASGKVRAIDYSPVLDRCNTSVQNRFEFALV